MAQQAVWCHAAAYADTAGIRESSDVVERLGVQRSREAAAEADVVVMVVDAQVGGRGELTGPTSPSLAHSQQHACAITDSCMLDWSWSWWDGVKEYEQQQLHAIMAVAYLAIP